MRAALALLLPSVALACAAGAGSAASRSESRAELSFVRGGSVYVASADGRRATPHLRARATPGGHQTTYTSPAWSPDGERVAAVLSLGPAGDNLRGSFRIVVGSSTRAVCGACEEPSWSPDGTRLVAVEVNGWDDYDRTGGGLFVVNVRTKRTRLLTPVEVARDGEPPQLGTDGQPAWSPDGRLVAFVRLGEPAPGPDYLTEVPRLHVVDTATRRVRRLTRSIAFSPSWSPDGKRLAFDDGRRIGIVGRNGGRPRFLTRGTDPAWSPDGTNIAFVRNGNVWVVSPGGGKARLAVRNAADRPGGHHGEASSEKAVTSTRPRGPRR